MSKVLNKGAMRQVKLSSGRIVRIPRGITTQPDDPKLKRLVDSKAKILFITNKDIAVHKQKAEKAAPKKVEPKKETPKRKASKKKKEQGPDKKD
jgi:hypothetical protein